MKSLKIFSRTTSHFFSLLLVAQLWVVFAMATIRYVKPTPEGNANGSSWANASGNLQTMIDASTTGDEVWVAAGIYKPDGYPTNCIGCTDSRNYAFYLKDDVAIFGGFAGTETQVTERNLLLNKTILSGDFNGDDLVTGSGSTLSITRNTENALHVIIAANGLIDGFTITGGNANIAKSIDLNDVEITSTFGGGIFTFNKNLELNNLIFEKNNSLNGGGAIASMEDTINLSNCIFSKNRSNNGGGIIGQESIINSTSNQFIENSARIAGGAIIMMSNGKLIIQNTLLKGNWTGGPWDYEENGGGAINVHGISILNLTNNVFLDNSTGGKGGAIWANNTPVDLVNNSLSGNSAYHGGGIYLFSDVNLNFNLTNNIFWGNLENGNTNLAGADLVVDQEELNVLTVTNCLLQVWNKGTNSIVGQNPLFVDAGNCNLRLQNGSPAIDAGTSIGAPSTDFDGNLRVDVIPGGGVVDIGAFEFQSGTSCPYYYVDDDHDGFGKAGAEGVEHCTNPGTGWSLLATDCNDEDPNINPDETEICDGIDNNCNGQTDEGVMKTWYEDNDNDGYSNGSTLVQCNQPDGYKLAANLLATSGDCNDENANLNPGATELCDGIDNNCNGQTDEGVILTWYKDADNDGYSSGRTLVQCSQPDGYKLAGNLIATSGDCNDAYDNIHPGAKEVCDGMDNNCDGQTDEGVMSTWYQDYDKDGYSNGTTRLSCGQPEGYKLAGDLLATSGDCNDNNPNIHPGATEVCDGMDNNCNGQTDEGLINTWYKDADNDGYSNGATLTQCDRPAGYKLAAELTATTGDCNDGNAAINPGATEICDGIDNNCNTQTDEGCTIGTTWYLDYDNDGYGNPAKKVQATTRPRGYIARGGDCRDWDPLSYPGAPETGDGIDNDCDGLVDEGLDCLKTWYYDGDGDGYGADAYTRLSCIQHNNYVLAGGDCKNWDANVYPGHGCPPVTGITGTDGNTTQPKAMVETSVEIQVFPNPARDEITVTLHGFEVGKKLELHMVQADGKVVSGQSLTPLTRGQQVRINVSRLSAGYYLLQVRQGEMQQTKKVLIVR